MTPLNLIAVIAVALSAAVFLVAAIANAAQGNWLQTTFYLGLVVVNGSLAIIQSGQQ